MQLQVCGVIRIPDTSITDARSTETAPHASARSRAGAGTPVHTYSVRPQPKSGDMRVVRAIKAVCPALQPARTNERDT